MIHLLKVSGTGIYDNISYCGKTIKINESSSHDPNVINCYSCKKTYSNQVIYRNREKINQYYRIISMIPKNTEEQRKEISELELKISELNRKNVELSETIFV